MPAISPARTTALAAIPLLAAVMTACESSPAPQDNAGRHAHAGPPAVTAMPPKNGTSRAPANAANNMNGMGPTAGGKGLRTRADGYHMASGLTTLPAAVPAAYTFIITAPDGTPVTSYATDQTRELHFYAIRSDLTGFQHVHPAMTPDGTWTAPLAALTPGRWRFYAAFTPATGPAAGTQFILSRTITVPGAHSAVPLPAPAAATNEDGYTITTAGYLMPGTAMPLTITITRHGKPVTTLQPYLGSYAHLTAIHAGDLAFAHIHPEGTTHGDEGGPTLTFSTDLSETGPWRLFLQFQTNDQVHTIPITVNPQPLAHLAPRGPNRAAIGRRGSPVYLMARPHQGP